MRGAGGGAPLPCEGEGVGPAAPLDHFVSRGSIAARCPATLPLGIAPCAARVGLAAGMGGRPHAGVRLPPRPTAGRCRSPHGCRGLRRGFALVPPPLSSPPLPFHYLAAISASAAAASATAATAEAHHYLAMGCRPTPRCRRRGGSGNAAAFAARRAAGVGRLLAQVGAPAMQGRARHPSHKPTSYLPPTAAPGGAGVCVVAA